MHITTIEEYFEYQINKIGKQVLDDFEKTSSDFATGEDYLNWLHSNAGDFGQRVVEAMATWKDEDEWLEDLQ